MRGVVALHVLSPYFLVIIAAAARRRNEDFYPERRV